MASLFFGIIFTLALIWVSFNLVTKRKLDFPSLMVLVSAFIGKAFLAATGSFSLSLFVCIPVGLFIAGVIYVAVKTRNVKVK